MRHFKKFLTAFVAVVMMLALSVSAFADDPTYSLSITNTTGGHTYEVYQIFKGDVSVNEETGGKVLSNYVYGSNYGDENTAVLEEVVNNIVNQAATIADKIEVKGDPFKTVNASVGTTTISNLPAGYYLVKEVTTTTPDNETISKNILQVVGNTSIAVKSGTTTSQKKVKDNETGSTWADSADYNIGDSVPFQLQATVASDYAHYSQYKLTFHDKQAPGLTFNKGSVKVSVNGTQITEHFTVSDACTDGCSFAIHFENLKQIPSITAGSKITVEYESTLNENAVIGAAGNANESKITYTNNPYDTEYKEGGNTPWDKVIVFTYEVVVDKYANDATSADNKLTGAEFTLTKADSTTPIAVIKSNDGTRFTFKGLDAGSYVLTETTTPTGYNTIDPIQFTITATHSEDDADPKLLTLVVNPSTILSANKDSGIISGNVINKAGASLPTTGGIGTKIFYVIGAILVIGASVLLISKKRMSAHR